MDRIHKEQSIVTGTLSCFENIGVIIGGKQIDRVLGQKGYTFWEIQPGGPENLIEVGPFYVCGRFQIVRVIEHSLDAIDTYRAFKAVSVLKESGEQ